MKYKICRVCGLKWNVSEKRRDYDYVCPICSGKKDKEKSRPEAKATGTANINNQLKYISFFRKSQEGEILCRKFI